VLAFIVDYIYTDCSNYSTDTAEGIYKGNASGTSDTMTITLKEDIKK